MVTIWKQKGLESVVGVFVTRRGSIRRYYFPSLATQARLRNLFRGKVYHFYVLNVERIPPYTMKLLREARERRALGLV